MLNSHFISLLSQISYFDEPFSDNILRIHRRRLWLCQGEVTYHDVSFPAITAPYFNWADSRGIVVIVELFSINGGVCDLSRLY